MPSDPVPAASCSCIKCVHSPAFCTSLPHTLPANRWARRQGHAEWGAIPEGEELKGGRISPED